MKLTWVILAAVAFAVPAAAETKDPLWPCVQRKVPTLLETQFWNGPALPQAQEPIPDVVQNLARDLAQRRIPMPEAETRIRDFAAAQPPDKRSLNLQLLYRAAFNELNGQRNQMMSGIARYSRKQLDMAASLRQQASELATLGSKPDADQNEISRRDEDMAAQTRIFEERGKSLTYICEVPTLIEQRIFALAKVISAQIKAP